MKTVIFVGGATASGKSTFVNNLSNSLLNSVIYRRYQGFFDIASQKGVSKKEIYEKITSDEVDNWFVDICKKSEVVISDVHYAVQMDRNEFALDSEIDIYQSYVPTISKTLIEKLSAENIKIVAIYLSCSPEQCLARAISRYNKKEKRLRNKSLEDAMLENSAEKREWDNLISLELVDGLELNSELYSSEELVHYCLEHLQKCEERELVLKKQKKVN